MSIRKSQDENRRPGSTGQPAQRPTSSTGSVPTSLTPRDLNAAPPSPQRESDKKSSAGDMAPQLKTAPAGTHTVTLPSYGPPYEPNIDLKFPMHFDSSADIFQWHADGDPLYEKTIDFEEDWFQLSKALGRGAAVGLAQAVTMHAKAASPNNSARSPLFFQVKVFPQDAPHWAIIHQPLLNLINQHFPPAEFPQLGSPPVLRYFLSTTEAYSLSPKSQQSAVTTMPASPPSSIPTPESLKNKWATHLRPEILSGRLDELWREEIAYDTDLSMMGGSVSCLQSRGKKVALTGTIGGFFLLKDENDAYIIDENDDKQVFGITSHHVLRHGDESQLSIEDAKNAALPVVHLSQRDRENTFLSRKGRHAHYKAIIDDIGRETKPDSPDWHSLDAGEQSRIQNAAWMLPSIQKQYNQDKAYAAKRNHIPQEEIVGEVYLCSGCHHSLSYAPLLTKWKTTDGGSARLPILIDYALVKIRPEFYPRCINIIPKTLHWPTEYPQVFDTLRAHRGLLSIGSLEPNTAVMKAGRSTGITFGKVQQWRYMDRVAPGLGQTHECYVEPLNALMPFCQRGDSGAVVLDEEGAMVGIVTAGDINKTTGEIYKPGFITPIEVIMEDLKVRFKRTLSPYPGYMAHAKASASKPPNTPTTAKGTRKSSNPAPAILNPKKGSKVASKKVYPEMTVIGNRTMSTASNPHRKLGKKEKKGSKGDKGHGVDDTTESNFQRSFSTTLGGGARAAADLVVGSPIAQRLGLTQRVRKAADKKEMRSRVVSTTFDPNPIQNMALRELLKHTVWRSSKPRDEDITDFRGGNPPAEAGGSGGIVLDKRIDEDGDVMYLVREAGADEGQSAEWYYNTALNVSWKSAIEQYAASQRLHAPRFAEARRQQRSTGSS